MKIVTINKNDAGYSAYSSFLKNNAGLFCQSEWLKIYPDFKVNSCAILNNNGDVIGCFNFFSFKKFFFSCVITPPFSPHISLTFINPAESIVGKNSYNKEVLEAVASYFKGMKVDLLDISLPAELVDTQPFTWQGFETRWRYSYWLNLDLTEQDLWERLSSEKRKSINKAKKDELVIELSQDREKVCELIISTLKNNQALNNENLIRKIILDESFKDSSYAFIAYAGTEVLGASFCVVDRNTAVYLFGGTAASNKHHGAGVSCMWNSILHAKKIGLKKFDFEGSMQPGIERYFREFGGELVPYASISAQTSVMSVVMKLKGKLEKVFG